MRKNEFAAYSNNFHNLYHLFYMISLGVTSVQLNEFGVSHKVHNIYKPIWERCLTTLSIHDII